MVRYYLNNPNLEKVPVATTFNINSSQVYSWVNKFEKDGRLVGLFPEQKRRLSKMSKKTKNKRSRKIKLSEKQKYEEKIIKWESEIERLNLENLVLKKWLFYVMKVFVLLRKQYVNWCVSMKPMSLNTSKTRSLNDI